MKLAYLYARASTIREVKQGSIQRQITDMKAYCEKHSLEYMIFQDEALTGTNDERPEFQKMITKALREKPYIVVCHKMDRFARSAKDLLHYVDILQKENIQFVAVANEWIDTTSIYGKLLLVILAGFAEFEVGINHERQQAGIIYARERGVKFGRPSLKTKSGKFLDPKVIIEKHNRGISARSIAKDMECSITPVLKVLKEIR